MMGFGVFPRVFARLCVAHLVFLQVFWVLLGLRAFVRFVAGCMECRGKFRGISFFSLSFRAVFVISHGFGGFWRGFGGCSFVFAGGGWLVSVRLCGFRRFLVGFCGFLWVPVSFGVSVWGFSWVFRGFPCFSMGLSGVGGFSLLFHVFFSGSRGMSIAPPLEPPLDRRSSER